MRRYSSTRAAYPPRRALIALREDALVREDAIDARAEDGDVGAVDVERDGDLVAGVLDAVDVLVRRDVDRDVAGSAHRGAGLDDPRPALRVRALALDAAPH